MSSFQQKIMKPANTQENVSHIWGEKTGFERVQMLDLSGKLSKVIKNMFRGTWVTQSVKRPTSAHDLTVCEFEPCVRLYADSLRAWSLLWILCLPLSLCPSPTCTLSLSQK